MLMRSIVSPSTKTISIVRNNGEPEPQCSSSIPAIFTLLASDRKAAFLNAATAFHQQYKSFFSAILLTESAIYTANRSNVSFYLMIKNKKQELIYYKKINNPLYDIAEEASREVAPGILDEEKPSSQPPASSMMQNAEITGTSFLLHDIKGNLIGHTFLNHTLFPAASFTKLQLPLGAEAFVLQDQSGLAEKISFSQMQAIVNAPDELEQVALRLVRNIPARKKAETRVYMMMTPIEIDTLPKLLCFSSTGSASRFFDVLNHEIQMRMNSSVHARKVFENKLLFINNNRYLLEEMDRHLVDIFPRKHRHYHHQILAMLCNMRLFRRDKIEFDSDEFNAAIDKLLFFFYVDVYRFSRKSGSFLTFHRSSLSDPMARCLEEIILIRYPKINTVTPHTNINHSNLTNKILWFAGSKYPELVVIVSDVIRHAAEINMPAKEFTNISKLLGRLGAKGFAESARLFQPQASEEYVKKSTIKEFYADQIEAKRRPS